MIETCHRYFKSNDDFRKSINLECIEYEMYENDKSIEKSVNDKTAELNSDDFDDLMTDDESFCRKVERCRYWIDSKPLKEEIEKNLKLSTIFQFEVIATFFPDQMKGKYVTETNRNREEKSATTSSETTTPTLNTAKEFDDDEQNLTENFQKAFRHFTIVDRLGRALPIIPKKVSKRQTPKLDVRKSQILKHNYSGNILLCIYICRKL